MKHHALERRVLAAEQRLAMRIDTTRAQVTILKDNARASVTPTRLVIGGVASGLAVGFAAPLARIGGLPKLLQLATGVMGFVNAMRVNQAAEQTEDAAEEVSDVSQQIDETV